MSKVKGDDSSTAKAEGNEETPTTGGFVAAGTEFPVPTDFALYSAPPPADASAARHYYEHGGVEMSDAGEGQVAQPQAVVLSTGLTLEDLRAAMQHFTHERDWDKYHTPRNLLCALVSEVGELSEIFQWRGEVERGLPDFSDDDKNHVAEELADVLLYLVRLSDVCGFDLGQAAINKLQINTQKYPPEAVRGSPAKYTTYDVSTRSRRHKKRARERFSEDQVAAMTELAEKAGWSITALTWEERLKFCQDYNITKERLCNFFNNRKPKEMKRGRNSVMRRATTMSHYNSYDSSSQYQQQGSAQQEEFLKHMNQ